MRVRAASIASRSEMLPPPGFRSHLPMVSRNFLPSTLWKSTNDLAPLLVVLTANPAGAGLPWSVAPEKKSTRFPSLGAVSSDDPLVDGLGCHVFYSCFCGQFVGMSKPMRAIAGYLETSATYQKAQYCQSVVAGDERKASFISVVRTWQSAT